MQFKLNLNYLKALNCINAKKDVRYYLNGVFFEINSNGLYLVATDGHKLALLHNHTIKSDEHIKAIMPREFIDQLSKNIDKKQLIADIAIVNDQFSINYKNNYYQVKAIDGTYPDYKRIFPENVSGEFAHYNFEYLVDFNKCMRLLTDKGNAFQVMVEHNGSKAGIVDLLFQGHEWNSMGLIMPMKQENTSHYIKKPFWLDYKEPEALKEVA